MSVATPMFSSSVFHFPSVDAAMRPISIIAKYS
jgi:hypothetical protein